jgi:hypothetical protein
MLTLIEGLGLGQITARVLHELALSVRAAETVGLALNRPIDGTIRLHILVIGETPGTHVAELAVCGIGRTGKADDKYASYEIFFHFGRSFRFGRPPVAYVDIGIRDILRQAVRPLSCTVRSRLSHSREPRETLPDEGLVVALSGRATRADECLL